MYTKASIHKQTALPSDKNDIVVLVRAKDIESDIRRAFGDTGAGGSLVLKEGAMAVSIEVMRSSISAGYDFSGAPGAYVFSDRVDFVYPGDSEMCSSLVEHSFASGVVAIVRKSGEAAKIYGSKDNPLVLSFQPVDDGNARLIRFSLTQRMGDAYVPRFYRGEIPYTLEFCGDWADAAAWDITKGW